MSPLLFGLFIERLEPWLFSRLRCEDRKLRGEIAQLGALCIAFLLFADDLVLLAHSAEAL
jgi:hypothetical protein